MTQQRKQFIQWLFEITQKFYLRFKRKRPWNISRQQLLQMPKNTVGYALGKFLDSQGFELIPKVERHDAYHLLTGFSTSVEDEIALQYLCFGNGKRTPYLLGVLLLGTLLLPDYLSYYRKAFSIGKASNSFHHYEYKKVLSWDYGNFRKSIFSVALSEQLQKIQHQYSTHKI
ncbi:hypothetical protein ACFQO1_11520 [Jejudonia soesokkakensis]|uniref:Coenzyme Q (Ubiquinone) biosynthesis protein Coq4 n=1 Tax=Jejudonia soesokkakensis TaxID=1323432 RepID=A0ABW2MTP6_9FLAO